MIRRPPRSTRTDTLFPYTTLFRSIAISLTTAAPANRHRWQAIWRGGWTVRAFQADATDRSEEHTSELQSLMRISYAVFCWKKNTQQFKPNKHLLNTH